MKDFDWGKMIKKFGGYEKIIQEQKNNEKHKERIKSYSKPEFIDGFGEDHSDFVDLPTGY